ncbi:hypothetical protein MPH_08719 [Macrophomina phaseolina MS6]|uniref:Uncharacterized protein n=1 Tax=Macrophomina phaseolina (strain MS6) TaxID=1126212 RepID=K2RVB8_MACPH|nr:hypothetical protein MPH_08719 [Macrophomina phaseolina MS6]
MKTTAAAALTLLATSVSAATYEQFPAGGLSCPTGAEGSTETTLAELKAAADSVVGTTPRETSASNLASGKCTSLSLPLYDLTSTSSLCRPALARLPSASCTTRARTLSTSAPVKGPTRTETVTQMAALNCRLRTSGRKMKIMWNERIVNTSRRCTRIYEMCETRRTKDQIYVRRMERRKSFKRTEKQTSGEYETST